MIATKLFLMVLAHFWGDYMLQPKKMAVKKSSSIAWCLLHCLIYTAVIVVATATFKPLFIIGVFVSHFIIDYNEVGMKWLRIMGGRDFYEEFISTNEYREIHLSFATLIYAVVDNTLHVTIMTLLLLLS